MDNFFRTILFHFLRNIPGAAQDVYNRASVEELKEVFCYNQAKLANYIFVSSRKHKQLKNELRKVQTFLSESPQEIPKLHELTSAWRNLSLYLDGEFRIVADQNFTFIKRFLSYKSFKKPPRISIRAIQGNHIITLARDRWLLTTEEEYPLGANTAFVEIEHSGAYYLCNDIPRAVKRGNYENARIYADEVRNHYQQPNLIRSLSYKMTSACDVSWQRCWRRVNSSLPPPETCYKSTLVIPMTLLNNGGYLSEEFCSHFRIQTSRRFANFGFLCIDSQITNFFGREDVSLGYIFSDILLVYLIQRLSCTTYSKSFTDASSILERYGVNLYG